MKIVTAALAGAIVLAAPLAAQAQNGGVAAGATTGAVGGAVVGGPVGAVVGGVGGAIVGGIIGDATTPKFRSYVVEQRVPSYTYADEVHVGTALPASGIQYYEVPAEYGVKNYRYTVVNNRTVLVDPTTRKVVQVIE
ncbi:DUF1236 domain-containing protein [Alsobacter sp. SYSU M60028]|uniref:DUF1236 domain-containing protein n=1 Tax=Alsobacter ponti TaxID=2962936 RepID=A0ABT1LID7_9HYPH|nr:DUF1236 domain-containing protein [Alsobacter ponti]MCP8940886.1 DUF1236 domain-containing protein [Alsobacter ponti]